MKSLEEIKRVNDEAVENFENKHLKVQLEKLSIKSTDILVARVPNVTSSRRKRDILDGLRSLRKQIKFASAIIIEKDLSLTTISPHQLDALRLQQEMNKD